MLEEQPCWAAEYIDYLWRSLFPIHLCTTFFRCNLQLNGNGTCVGLALSFPMYAEQG